MKKKPKSDKQIRNIAQTCTRLIADSGASAEDALAIVLDMLRYHAGLVLAPNRHEVVVDAVVAVLRREIASEEFDGDLKESLNSFIDPSSPEFDPVFAKTIMEQRPDWFTEQERDAVKNATQDL